MYCNMNECERAPFFYTRLLAFYTGFVPLLHTWRTRMAAIVKLPSGSWRAQVRRKGKYVTATFLRRKDADEGAPATERNIDRGVMPNSPDPKSVRTLSSIIDLHIRDHKEVGKPIRRSMANVLETLRIILGDTRIHDLKRSKLIEYGKRRAKEGAGPATLAIDFSFLGTLLTHSAAVHGIEVFPEEVKLARVALSRLAFVGKGVERDRRPTQDELTSLVVYFNHKPRQLIPMARIIRFAVATAMRQEEICKFEWTDVDIQKRLVTVCGLQEFLRRTYKNIPSARLSSPRIANHSRFATGLNHITKPKSKSFAATCQVAYS